MSEKKSYQSWTISDEFWERVKEDIPKTERDPKKDYVYALGQGRKPMPERKALTREYGSGSSVHRTF